MTSKTRKIVTQHEYGRDGKKLPYLVLCTVCKHEWYHKPQDGEPECSWCAFVKRAYDWVQDEDLEEERGKISPTGFR
jgi:hypothetical protein